MKLSILIVNYNVGKKLIKCLESLYVKNTKTEFEIIVVENGTEDLKAKLKDKFPKVKYIKSKQNLGYGGGNNLAAKNAKGDYLFILNPDTLVLDNAVDNLLKFISNNKKTGIVSPLLVDKDLKPFKTQSRKELTPLRSVLSFSFLRKIFSRQSIYNDPTLEKWDYKSPLEVDAIPGAAFLIPKKLFDKLHGFDESFFLYFEENDLSKRVKNLGYHLYIIPTSKVLHEVGQSTKQIDNKIKVFEKSRFLFLKKHYGLLKAILAETIIRSNSTTISLLFILFIAFVLRIFNLSTGMPFIGDYAWFYLSARDIFINGTIPLVGITSSHIWLHQGPLWTYVLSPFLFLFKFNPISGAYITTILGILATYVIYLVTKGLFSKKAGLIASILYATSPLIISSDRTPYHTSPIPFFVILYFYSLSKWVKGSRIYFPVTVFLISILYNFELATFILFFPFLLFFLFGIYKKRTWFTNILTLKYAILSLFGFLIPMFPILIYDMSHGFRQTLVFFAWTVYKPISSLNKFDFFSNSNNIIGFLVDNFGKMVFSYSSVIASLIVLFSFLIICTKIFTVKRNKTEDSLLVLLLLLMFSILGIVVNKTPSDAYLPMIFPLIIISVALMFEYALNTKIIKYFSFVLIMIIVLSNVYVVLKLDKENKFGNLTGDVNKILKITDKKEYNLVGKGVGSQFASFTMNYEYLLWWKGYPPSKDNVKLKIYIISDGKNINIYKND